MSYSQWFLQPVFLPAGATEGVYTLLDVEVISCGEVFPYTHYWFPGVAVIKHHELCGLKQQKFIGT